MAQLVLGAAGAALGFVVGGPTGAQIGWAVGSTIGAAAFAPTVKTQGPRIQDLKVTGTEYGQPIPWVAGHPASAGQIWWASDRREIATTTEEGGKGGPTVESTSYTYEVDLLIGLTDNVIQDVARIWMNGKLVFTRLSTSSSSSTAASDVTEVWRRMTVYGGGPSQLPDPTYEAAVGTANASAYRGRGSVFIEGLQLGSGGQIPLLVFEIVAAGSTSSQAVVRDLSPDARDATLHGNVTTSTAQSKFGDTALFWNTPQLPANYISLPDSSDFSLATGDFTIEAWVYLPTSLSGNQIVNGGNAGTSGTWGFEVSVSGFRFVWFQGGSAFQVISGAYPTSNTWTHLAVVKSGATITLFQDGVIPGTGTPSTSANTNIDASTSLRVGGVTGGVGYYGYMNELRITKRARYSGSFTPPSTRFATSIAGDSSYGSVVLLLREDSVPLVAPANDTVSNVVSNLCLRAGLTAGQIDVTALATITKPVRALAVSQTGATRAVLDMLAGAYYFETVLSDKLYFRPRGGASAVTIPYADLGASSNPNGSDEPLALRLTNEIEVPAQVALTYINVDNDYQNDTQWSDRLLSSAKTTNAVQMALGLTASEAKAIANTMVADAIASRVTTTLELLPTYAKYEPTDVVTVAAEDASTFRVRLLKKTDDGSVLKFDAVLDDASVLMDSATTSSDYTSSITVAAAPSTSMVLMDIPILRDADDDAGFYVAAKGSSTTWPGAAIFRSRDDIDYSRVKDVTDTAVLGVCTTILGSWTGGNVFDEVNTVTVDVGNGTLSSSTHDLVLDTGANACLVGSEVLYFRTATLSSAGIYVLSGLLRGRRGTESSMTTHVANESFVLLQTTGLRRVTLETSEIGALMYYKGVTLGRSLSTAPAQTLTGAAVGLKPFSPVDVRATRSVATSDITITWSRRTRRATAFTNGSVPLGEATEAYEVDIYTTSGFVTVKRTVTGITSATTTYTSAQQVTDFGSNQATIYVRVYQISEVVGRGFAGQGAV